MMLLVRLDIKVKRNEAIEDLKGKTISEIEHGSYMDMFTIDAIVFTDGTRLELGGSCDYSYIEDIITSDDKQLEIEN